MDDPKYANHKNNKGSFFKRSKLEPRFGLFLFSIDGRLVFLLFFILWFREWWMVYTIGLLIILLTIADFLGLSLKTLMLRIRSILAGKHRRTKNRESRLKRYKYK